MKKMIVFLRDITEMKPGVTSSSNTTQHRQDSGFPDSRINQAGLDHQQFSIYRRWRSPSSVSQPRGRGDRPDSHLQRRIKGMANTMADMPTLRLNQVRKGKLQPSDGINNRRRGRFFDDYILMGKKTAVNQFIRLQLRSKNFDTFLQIFDAQTDTLLLSNDDFRHGNRSTLNSHLSLALQPDRTYRIRVTSYGERETGQYTLRNRTVISRNQNFSFAYGSGLIDAAAAVSVALGNMPLGDAIGEPGTESWNLEQMKAPDAWKQGITGKDVVVAVIDTGVDLSHPDLTQNLWQNQGEIPDNGTDDDGNGFIDDAWGWDFVDDDGRPGDLSFNFSGHGTHVAGIVAAAQNDIGITGVAPDATIMPVRVLDRNGTGTARDVAKGIRYAAANGADVINLSLGSAAGSKISRSIRKALRFARQEGVAVAIAAGNERQNFGSKRSGEPAFWAATRDAGIAVGAIDRNGVIANFSNPTGNRPGMSFLVAPGVEVNSLVPTGFQRRLGISLDTQPLSGTSMATPHVAGLMALMLNANPDLTPAQMSRILAETANRRDVVAV